MVFIKAVQNNFTPPKIIGRGDEIKRIRGELDTFKKIQYCDNLLIDGISGSGKTTVLRDIADGDEHIIYTSAFRCDNNALSWLRSLCDHPVRTHEAALQLTLTKFSKERRIIVIDEVDKFTQQRKFIQDLNIIYRETATPIIIATNKKRFISTMPDDARNTLHFKQILFQPYSATQLGDIVISRCQLAKWGFDESGDDLESRYATIIGRECREYGARMAITVLRTLILEDNKAPTTEQVKKIINEIMADEMGGVIPRLRDGERAALLTLAEWVVKHKQGGVLNNRTYVVTGDKMEETITTQMRHESQYELQQSAVAVKGPDFWDRIRADMQWMDFLRTYNPFDLFRFYSTFFDVLDQIEADSMVKENEWKFRLWFAKKEKSKPGRPSKLYLTLDKKLVDEVRKHGVDSGKHYICIGMKRPADKAHTPICHNIPLMRLRTRQEITDRPDSERKQEKIKRIPGYYLYPYECVMYRDVGCQLVKEDMHWGDKLPKCCGRCSRAKPYLQAHGGVLIHELSRQNYDVIYASIVKWITPPTKHIQMKIFMALLDVTEDRPFPYPEGDLRAEEEAALAAGIPPPVLSDGVTPNI
jgi:Cdc6-like AAA superfamily ATPase